MYYIRRQVMTCRGLTLDEHNELCRDSTSIPDFDPRFEVCVRILGDRFRVDFRNPLNPSDPPKPLYVLPCYEVAHPALEREGVPSYDFEAALRYLVQTYHLYED